MTALIRVGRELWTCDWEFSSPANRDLNCRDFGVVCLSHVQWTNAWQRNHHTMHLFSKKHKVLYITPWVLWYDTLAKVHDSGSQGARINSNLLVISPFVLRGERLVPFLKILNKWLLIADIREKIRAMQMQNIVLWFYSPQHEYLTGSLDEMVTVYDIQDEYSAYLGNPQEITKREKRLLQKVDLVFTGTHALYEERNKYYENIHFIPCGVDFTHFHRATSDLLPLPEDISGISHPILGYFGMVCARMDTELLDYLASQRPEWSIVLIGEIVENDFTLERRPNIYLLGRKNYLNLPAYLQAFDICMIPFKLNELTLKVNPTKLLEYLAAGKPVISTAIPDMIKFYGDVIEVAESKEHWLELAEKLWQEINQDDSVRMAKGQELARQRSWQAMKTEMEQWILATCRAKHGVQ